MDLIKPDIIYTVSVWSWGVYRISGLSLRAIMKEFKTPDACHALRLLFIVNRCKPEDCREAIRELANQVQEKLFSNP
jgi:hypothetical protein